MKTYLLVTFFITNFLFAIPIIAQSNYKAGYIVTNNNDTVYGQIDYRTDAVNASRCKFKPQNGSPEITYYPGDISSYRFTPEGKYYVSRQVQVDNGSNELFLEYLVKGMVDLYYCDLKGKKYYFFEKDGVLTEFTQKAENVVENHVVIDNKYKGMVRYYFKDYPSISATTDKMDFNQKSFIDIAKLYHDETCTTGEKCLIYVNKNPDEKSVVLKVSLYAGLQWNTYTITEYSYYTETETNLESTRPVIGGKLNLFNPRWSKSFSIQADISLSAANATAKRMLGSTNTAAHYRIKSMLISGKMGLEYKLPLQKIQPRIGGGFVYTHLFSEKGELFYSNSVITSDYLFRRSYPGFFVNVGVDYMFKNKQAVYIQGSIERYMKSDAMQHNGRDKFGSFNLVAGYTF